MPKPGPDREATDERILKTMRDAYPPALGTSDIADRVGVSRQVVDRHLRDLVDRELVNTTMVGQSRIWWLDDDGKWWLSNQD